MASQPIPVPTYTDEVKKDTLTRLLRIEGQVRGIAKMLEDGRSGTEILQQLAKGLQISSESLYVKAGFLDEHTVSEHRPWDVEAAVAADPALTDRQKDTLIDIYRSFVGEKPAGPSESASTPKPPAKATKKTATRAPATTTGAARRASRTTTSAPKKTRTKTTTTKE